MLSEILNKSGALRLGCRAMLWHAKYLALRKPYPLACNFYITSRCNFRCSFCNIWRLKPVSQRNRAEDERIVRELGGMGLIYFSIAGGEPLLVPYMSGLLALAKDSGILYTHLVSNGYLMDFAKAKALAAARLSEISFSLDGPEETHDTQRAVKGAYRHVIEAIKLMQQHAPSVDIVLNSILFAQSPELAMHAVGVAKELGVKIKIQPANDHPVFDINTQASKAQRVLSEDDKKRLFDVVDTMIGDPHVTNSKPFLVNYKKFIENPDDIIFSGANCIYGYHHMEIFGDSAYACLEGVHWTGGVPLAGRSVAEAVSTPKYLAMLKKLKKCAGCKRNFYVCYYEPRINFPVWNLVRSRLS